MYTVFGSRRTVAGAHSITSKRGRRETTRTLHESFWCVKLLVGKGLENELIAHQNDDINEGMEMSKWKFTSSGMQPCVTGR